LAGPAVVVAALLAAAGCGGDSPGADDDHDDGHAGHVIPAHRPKTFPDAVRRLRELNDRIGRGPARETTGIALDIANWLPEIAAESDMPPGPWDEVNARSAELVSDYRTILAGPAAGDPGAPARHAGEAIAGLEGILAAADGRWFTVPGHRHEEPGGEPAASGARPDQDPNESRRPSQERSS
jgi:hypothetical protein